MIFLGGGIFRVTSFDDAKRDVGSIPRLILSEVSGVLRRERYKVTKPKPTRDGGVRIDCHLTETVGLSFSVAQLQSESTGGPAFLIVAFGGHRQKHDPVDARARVTEAWKHIQATMEHVTLDVYSTRIAWLTSKEVDALAQQETEWEDKRAETSR